MKIFFKKKIFLIIIFLIFFAGKASSLEKATHEFINENVAKQNWFDSHLKTNLGLKDGIKELLNGKQILKWLADGGRTEDEPAYSRSLNHFHDPLKSWNSAGFKGTFKSSVIWAQDQGWVGSQFGGDWSWKKARNSFYKGLTGSSKTERDTNLADVFRAIGQVMHLVEDASVPAHVRNDTHVYLEPFGIKIGKFHYEAWVEKNHGNLNLNPLSFDKSILSLTPESSAPIPIANIIDTNQYKSDGSNPNVTIGSIIGLSEFTNANFFSEGTIFKNYPHPRKENTTAKLVEQYAKDGKTDKVWYIQGYTSQRLAAYSYLNKWLLPDKWEYNLDGFVYGDYASQLIPRAVGYSAGLLNYFFRGEIDMVPDEEKGSGYVIANNTDEDMSGTFELWYDNNNDERKPVKSWTLAIGKKSSGNNKSTNITFTPPTDAKESVKYMLVFRGKLGNEEDAVVGKEMNLTRDFLFFVKAFPVWTNVGNGWIDVWKTLVFEMKTANNQYQLEPVTQNINFTVWDSPSSLLTVQSNPDQNEHKVALPWRYGKLTTYNPNIAGYGKWVHYFTDWLGYAHYYIIGFPQAYIPKNFNDDKSPYIWDSNFTYGEWVSTGKYPRVYSRPASYIHGRRPFKLIDKKLVARNINARKNDVYTYSGDDYSGPFYIQYKDESGKWIRGVDLPYETYRPGEYQPPIEKYTHLAILDIDKTIYIKDEEGKEYKLIAGDSILHITPGYTSYSNLACGECSLGCGIELYGEERTWPEREGWPLLCSGVGSWGFTTFRIIPSDYDNMNGDDTFIMFFAEEKYSRDQAYFEEVFRDGAGCCAVRFTGTFGQSSLTDTFYLTYRTNSSAIQKIILAEAVLINDYHNQQIGVSGTRITGMSSQINKENIVYTYIKQKPNNNNPCGGWDCPNMWEPDKRVIGIINIADPNLPIGHRQEFEITEANAAGFLTDIYKDYDYKDLAAIGVHREAR